MSLSSVSLKLRLLKSLSTRLSVSSCCEFSSSSSLFSREQFIRDKENINIVTLGSHQHGKTWLASHLSLLLSHQNAGVSHRRMENIDQSASERENRRSETVTHLELWRTGSRYRFTLADLPGHINYIKNMLSHLAHADVALLVVSPEHGVDDLTVLYHHLAAHLGVKLILPVIMFREETDQETLDLINMELGELDNISDTVIIEPDNLVDLLEDIETRVDNEAVIADRDINKPFFMALEQVGNIPSRGIFCAGRVLQGSMTVGASSLEVFYQGRSSRVSVRDLEIFRRATDSLVAGDRGGAFLKPKQEIELKRGAVLYDPKLKLTASAEFEVSLRRVKKGKSSLKGEGVIFHSTSSDGKVSVTGGDNLEISDYTDSLVKLRLSQKILARSGDPVVLRNNHSFYKGFIVV